MKERFYLFCRLAKDGTKNLGTDERPYRVKNKISRYVKSYYERFIRREKPMTDQKKFNVF